MDKSTIDTDRRDYNIQTKLDGQKISLTVFPNDYDLEVSAWETQITDLNQCSQILSNLFENIVQFYDHLQDVNNLKVDCRNGVVSVLLKTTIKNKQSLSEIAKIKLKPSTRYQYRNIDLNKICKICQKDQQVSNKLMLKMIGAIANNLLKPTEQQDVNELLDPIISKFRLMGLQNDTLKIKIATAMQQLEQIRQMHRKQNEKNQHEMQISFGQLKDYIQTIKQGIDREIIRCENKYEVISLDFQDNKTKMMKETKEIKMNMDMYNEHLNSIRDYISNLETQILLKLDNYGGEKPMVINKIQGIQRYIDTTTPFFRHFKTGGMTVVKVTPTLGISTILVGNFSMQQKNRYTVRIKKLGKFPMLIGMIDGKHRLQQNCQQKDNRIWFASDGAGFDSDSQVKSPIKFQTNSIVTFTANFSKNQVALEVKQKIHKIPCKILANKSIRWYPCLWIGQAEDAIQWINN